MYFNDTDREGYRSLHSGLVFSRVAEAESDLHLGVPKSAAQSARQKAAQALPEIRAPLLSYIQAHPEFKSSLSPLPETADMPQIAREMVRAAALCRVGPMAAVAGAVADALAQELSFCDELIIENGGDIHMRTKIRRSALIYAGRSPLSNKLAVEVPPGVWGICTSSATVGPALSFGNADAALIVAKTATLADAAASTLGNAVRSSDDIEPALDTALAIPGVLGALVIIGGAFGAKGEITLLRFTG